MIERGSNLDLQIESFILKNFPRGKIVEIGSDLTKKPLPAVSPRFRQFAEGRDLLVIEDNNFQARYIVRKKSPIRKLLNSASGILVPECYQLGSSHEIFQVPNDSMYLGLFNVNSLSSIEETQLAAQVPDVQLKLVRSNRNLLVSLKDFYGDIKLEDVLTGSVINSSISFIG